MVRVRTLAPSDIRKGLFDSSRTIRVNKNKESASLIYAPRFILSVLNPLFDQKSKSFHHKTTIPFKNIVKHVCKNPILLPYHHKPIGSSLCET